MQGVQSPQCVNCGQNYDPKHNSKRACCYHPSNFGLMGKVARGIGYACCLHTNINDPGCRTGPHTTVYKAGNRTLRDELDRYLSESSNINAMPPPSTARRRTQSAPVIARVSTRDAYVIRVGMGVPIDEFQMDRFLSAIAKASEVEERCITVLAVQGDHPLVSFVFSKVPDEKELAEKFENLVELKSPALSPLNILTCHVTPPADANVSQSSSATTDPHRLPRSTTDTLGTHILPPKRQQSLKP